MVVGMGVLGLPEGLGDGCCVSDGASVTTGAVVGGPEVGKGVGALLKVGVELGEGEGTSREQMIPD